MIRGVPRSTLIIFVFLMTFCTFNLLITNDRLLKSHLEKKIESNELATLFANPLHLVNIKIYPEVKNYELKDWHDRKFMAYEAARVGPGENGSAFELTDPDDIKKSNKLREIEGLNVYVSDKISVNRSLPDVRHKKCRTKLYLKHLPRASVVVIFHNEHPSLIFRTLHSIVNRTPRELLGEIILVNDASTKPELNEPLEKYITENFPGIVKLVTLKKRVGLIVARMEGARKASEEVLVFLDSHIEVNVNWLPPLLEPIAMNPRTASTPIIDRYNWLTFKYEVHAAQGVRGIFAWDFDFRSTAQRKTQPTHPKPTPIMLGCAFAINRQYFWDLGAYDDQLLIWNAENYELSMKLWLCGGELVEAPCSRVAHVFRSHNEFRRMEGIDFVGRNFKRFAEVWLDDWKQYLYKTDPVRYKNIDAGDLTKQKLIRQKLNCKPFDYFVYHVAPEMLTISPRPRPDDVAYGVLTSFLNATNYCISDYLHKGGICSITDECNKPKNMPHRSQYFHLSAEDGIQHDRAERCFENIKFQKISGYKFKKNRWTYDLETNQIILNGMDLCIAGDIYTRNLTLVTCDSSEMNQRWNFGYVNTSMTK